MKIKFQKSTISKTVKIFEIVILRAARTGMIRSMSELCDAVQLYKTIKSKSDRYEGQSGVFTIQVDADTIDIFITYMNAVLLPAMEAVQEGGLYMPCFESDDFDMDLLSETAGLYEQLCKDTLEKERSSRSMAAAEADEQREAHEQDAFQAYVFPDFEDGSGEDREAEKDFPPERPELTRAQKEGLRKKSEELGLDEDLILQMGFYDGLQSEKDFLGSAKDHDSYYDASEPNDAPEITRRD